MISTLRTYLSTEPPVLEQCLAEKAGQVLAASVRCVSSRNQLPHTRIHEWKTCECCPILMLLSGGHFYEPKARVSVAQGIRLVPQVPVNDRNIIAHDHAPEVTALTNVSAE
jgi:hypothetical protein